MRRFRPLLAGFAAGLLIAVARMCAYFFAWGWHASNEWRDLHAPAKRYVPPSIIRYRKN